MLKQFRFKNDIARAAFRGLLGANVTISDEIGNNTFWGMVDEDKNIYQVYRNKDAEDQILEDYDPVFFNNEINSYLIECTDPQNSKPSYDELLAENADLRARLAKLEIRVNRLEGLL